MDKRNKIDVDDEVYRHKHQADVEFTTSSKHEGPFSSDPFAINYRDVPDLNHPRALAAMIDCPLTPKQLAYVTSAEWAEKMRPSAQFDVRVKERGLLEKYQHIMASQSELDEKFERLQNLFQKEAPGLRDSFMIVWDRFCGHKGQAHSGVSKL
ncbi:MAG: hypothetical protein M1830_010254 [Pleopsidium flavum]|nr:MAG: hypothetical protein M1830_010254 [Pleopsidium flavum]